MRIYHFTNTEGITKFKHTRTKRDYSQSKGKGIYFTAEYNKGLMFYGTRSKYCYICEYLGDKSKIINLGEFDSMFYNGTKDYYGSYLTANFKRTLEGFSPLKLPDIRLESISNNAYAWLKRRDIGAVTGSYSESAPCSEFCVLDGDLVKIIRVVKLSD